MKTFAAGGDIGTALFVKRSTAADNTVLQADLNSMPTGISQRWTEVAPTSGAAVYAASSGGSLEVHHVGLSGDPRDSTVFLTLGASVTRGSLLMPDANGAGITATSGKYAGAIADQSGSSGELIMVTPVLIVAP